MSNRSYLRALRQISLANYVDDAGEVRWTAVQDAVSDAYKDSTTPKQRALEEAERRFGPSKN